jgi:hypothetical protein
MYLVVRQGVKVAVSVDANLEQLLTPVPVVFYLHGSSLTEWLPRRMPYLR